MSQSRPERAARHSWVRFGRIAGHVVAVAFAGVLLLVAVGPRVAPFQVLYVRSPSMAPGMPVGSLAIVERVQASSLHVRDVITFEHPTRPGELVTHRIVGTEVGRAGRLLVTRGDANNVADPWRVPAVGTGWRRVASVPYLGFALGHARAVLATPGMLPALVWGSVGLLLVKLWRSPGRPAPRVA